LHIIELFSIYLVYVALVARLFDVFISHEFKQKWSVTNVYSCAWNRQIYIQLI